MLQERKLRTVSHLYPSCLVNSAVILFKIRNQGQSEQALGKWRDKGLNDSLLQLSDNVLYPV